MAIRRLTREELEEEAINIFYNYMSSNDSFYSYGEIVKCTEEYPTPMHMLWKETQDSIQENASRIKMFEEDLENNKNNEGKLSILKEQIELLQGERKHFLKSNMKYQKKLYKDTKDLGYSRNVVRIPLDKLINSYYDDFLLEVVFYDDIGVNDGVYDQYKALSSTEQRRNFIISNTEITHMGLVVIRGSSHICTTVFRGGLKKNSNNILILDKEFADLSELRLSDINEIKNNDVKQFFQSKIDLDKENLEVVANKEVRGDNYKILKGTYGEDDLYIRYICPSTGRVYFNKLSIPNLALSNYFKKEDYESYINAWWSINNLGASIEGDNILRC